MKELVKQLLPNSILKTFRPLYHGGVALLASFYFNHPSKKLKVIGVTGTAGKSTTVNLLAHILNSAHHKTGFTTTVNLNLGDETKLNKIGISMTNEWLMQKSLHQMVENNCEFAIVESTSEGLAQNRHLGIKFYGALFTNLSPAHLDAHGNFENYKKAKGKLFCNLDPLVDNFIGVNLDDSNWDFFASFPAKNYFGITTSKEVASNFPQTLYSIDQSENNSSVLNIGGQVINLPIVGDFNAQNAALAAATAAHLGIDWQTIAKALTTSPIIPGRMEFIDNSLGAQIIVDFACEPKPMLNFLQAASKLSHKRIVHIFGSTGGLRDKAKRFEFGKISARLSDKIIITNDDVYGSDPNEIANNIKSGIESVSQNERKVKEVEIILDRKTAIQSALSQAQAGDLLLFTGKASEQFLILPGNNRIDWDERAVIKEELKNIQK